MKEKKSYIWSASEAFCNLATQYPNLTLARVLSQEKDLWKINFKENADISETFIKISDK